MPATLAGIPFVIPHRMAPEQHASGAAQAELQEGRRRHSVAEMPNRDTATNQERVLQFRITEEQRVVIEVRDASSNELIRTIPFDERPAPGSGRLIDSFA